MDIEALYESYAACEGLGAFLKQVMQNLCAELGADAGTAFVIRSSDDSALTAEKAWTVCRANRTSLKLEANPEPALRLIKAIREPTRLQAQQAGPLAGESGTEWLLAPVCYQQRLIAALFLHSAQAGRFAQLPECLSAWTRELSFLIRRLQLAEWSGTLGRSTRIIGKSAALRGVDRLVERFSQADCPVLITGETGTGKELIAQAICFNSRRRSQPFVAVNCGAFTSDELLATELFGHAKGAFTGAIREKKGKFELAHRGTLFLDEVSSMKPVMQTTLLRTLRSGEVQRVGDERIQRLFDVRIIAATNQPLDPLVESGEFRYDTFARLRVAEIHMPPLRQRREDIHTLTDYFIQRYSRIDQIEPKPLSEAALDALTSFEWPGNIAALENAVRIALLMGGDRIEVEDLPVEVRGGQGPSALRAFSGRKDAGRADAMSGRLRRIQHIGLKRFLGQSEAQIIEDCLKMHHGAVRKTARFLKMSPSTLAYKIQKYGIYQ